MKTQRRPLKTWIERKSINRGKKEQRRNNRTELQGAICLPGHNIIIFTRGKEGGMEKLWRQ